MSRLRSNDVLPGVEDLFDTSKPIPKHVKVAAATFLNKYRNALFPVVSDLYRWRKYPKIVGIGGSTERTGKNFLTGKITFEGEQLDLAKYLTSTERVGRNRRGYLYYRFFVTIRRDRPHTLVKGKYRHGGFIPNHGKAGYMIERESDDKYPVKGLRGPNSVYFVKWSTLDPRMENTFRVLSSEFADAIVRGKG